MRISCRQNDTDKVKLIKSRTVPKYIAPGNSSLTQLNPEILQSYITQHNVHKTYEHSYTQIESHEQPDDKALNKHKLFDLVSQVLVRVVSICAQWWRHHPMVTVFANRWHYRISLLKVAFWVDFFSPPVCLKVLQWWSKLRKSLCSAGCRLVGV